MTDKNNDVVNHVEGDLHTAVQVGNVGRDLIVHSAMHNGGPPPPDPKAGRLTVLAVDDEAHALAEIVHLLRQDSRVGKVDSASDAVTAARYITQVLRQKERLDAVFLDIEMPGLNGLDLAWLITRFAEPPGLVFVTAWEKHAIEAFELEAVDYLVKPVRKERLGDTVRKLLDRASPHDGEPPGDPLIPVERDGVEAFLRLSEVRMAELDGDRARLTTASGEFSVRVPAAVLTADWATSGFVRIDEWRWVAVEHVENVRLTGRDMTVQAAGRSLAVGAEYRREARRLLVHSRRRPEHL
ncbi:LytTR family DNA-binding domain-containing protein [Amycolatopsis sp. CA-128772]|uniref:LytR/AlgR family response regulator transcription factor n=1 Tax=Amycolatopsis sp. CA-128772 TaxID=2073159 RepID=UPI000CD03B93|nr:response regulator [Amycolatopsis sp. CA-128772]